MSLNLADIRKTYAQQALDETAAAGDPLTQFGQWLDEALRAQVDEPTAMVLATVGADGQPSARVVLLKGYDAAGFTFFTNYASHKGHDLAANPRAALTFFWPALERQVRVEGIIEPISEAVSESYFQSRPRASQIGAWASPQSQPIPDRAALEVREREVADRFADQNPLPRPPHWGGYVLHPHRLEFWQGRPSRLHDRLQYDRQPDGSWHRVRLAP